MKRRLKTSARKLIWRKTIIFRSHKVSHYFIAVQILLVLRILRIFFTDFNFLMNLKMDIISTIRYAVFCLLFFAYLFYNIVDNFLRAALMILQRSLHDLPVFYQDHPWSFLNRQLMKHGDSALILKNSNEVISIASEPKFSTLAVYFHRIWV